MVAAWRIRSFLFRQKRTKNLDSRKTHLGVRCNRMRFRILISSESPFLRHTHASPSFDGSKKCCFQLFEQLREPSKETAVS